MNWTITYTAMPVPPPRDADDEDRIDDTAGPYAGEPTKIDYEFDDNTDPQGDA